MKTFTIAIGQSGLNRPIKEGTVHSDRFELKYVEVTPIIAAFRRMCRGLEFDICEMAMTTYLCAKAYGKPFTAIPVFPFRKFHHGSILCSVSSGIQGPHDLEGRTVGVNRGYTVTAGLWARGILKSEYGVDLSRITWAPTDEEHVSEYQAPPNVDYSNRGKAVMELLRSGAIDAAVGDIRADSADIRPVISDPIGAGFAYFGKTGIYPINHTIVIRDSVLQDEPGLARELFDLFASAKKSYLARLESGTTLSAADCSTMEIAKVVRDPFPLGIHSNRQALETLIDFAVDQRVLSRRASLDELFATDTLQT